MGFPQGNRANPAGRSKGSRNRLSGAFLTALADDFEQHGIEAIRITRIESPDIYCRSRPTAKAENASRVRPLIIWPWTKSSTPRFSPRH